MLILLFADRSAASALCMQALKQWYETMIPALFPMMLLSSILVDTGFAQKIGNLLHHTLLRLFKISDHGCYCFLTGFFFGFPMGAKTTAELYEKGCLSKKEAEYLMGFINCLGPMYTINLTHMLFPDYALWKLLAGIYGTAILYGLLLRYTLYRKESFCNTAESIHPQKKSPEHNVHTGTFHTSLAEAIYASVPKCGKSILILGGYMVFFQVSFISIDHLLNSINMMTNVLYPLIEVTGGFFLLSKHTSLPSILFYSTFTGICCHVQTYSFLRPAGLSMKKYIIHKSILSQISYIIGLLLAAV